MVSTYIMPRGSPLGSSKKLREKRTLIDENTADLHLTMEPGMTTALRDQLLANVGRMDFTGNGFIKATKSTSTLAKGSEKNESALAESSNDHAMTNVTDEATTDGHSEQKNDKNEHNVGEDNGPKGVINTEQQPEKKQQKKNPTRTCPKAGIRPIMGQRMRRARAARQLTLTSWRAPKMMLSTTTKTAQEERLQQTHWGVAKKQEPKITNQLGPKV